MAWSDHEAYGGRAGRPVDRSSSGDGPMSQQPQNGGEAGSASRRLKLLQQLFVRQLKQDPATLTEGCPTFPTQL